MKPRRTVNLRIVLLCAALFFQVLTFAKHNGVSFLATPGAPESGVGSTVGSGDSLRADRVGSGSSTTVASYPNGSGSFTSAATGSGARLVAAVGTSQTDSGPGGGLGGSEAEPNAQAPLPLPGASSSPVPAGSQPTPGSAEASDSGQRSEDNPASKPPSSGGAANPAPQTLDFERVDLMPQSSSSGSEAETSQTCFNPVAGFSQMAELAPTNGPGLDVSVPSFGKVGCNHEWEFHQGPIGKSVTVEADLHLDSPNASAEFNVCALVLYEEGAGWPTEESCEEVTHSKGSGAIHVSLTQDAHTARLQQVYFILEAFENPLAVTLSNPHLFVEQAKGSVGPR